MRGCVVALFAGIVGFSTFVFAEDKPAPKKDDKVSPQDAQFKKLDKDNDGKLTMVEFVAEAKDRPVQKGKMELYFKKLDKNNDGSLTLEEFKTPVAPPKRKL